MNIKASAIALSFLLALVAVSAQNVCVGVGTQSPEYKLDVDGTFRVTDTSYFASSVGIGTSAPKAPLDVQGSTRRSGTGTVSSEEERVIGTNTEFMSEVSAGDVLIVGTEKRAVIVVERDNVLVVDAPFSDDLSSEQFEIESPIARFADDAGNTLASVNARGDVQTAGQVVGKGMATAEEDLRIIRGTVNADATIAEGEGFTVVRREEGVYDITFDTPFAAPPSGSVNAICNKCTINAGSGGLKVPKTIAFGALEEDQVTVLTPEYGTLVGMTRVDRRADTKFTFVIVGPR